MNAHVARNNILLLSAGSVGHYFEDEDNTYVVPAEPKGLRLFARIGNALRWIAELPRRRAVLDELGSLSDHELADIGLTRSDLPRLFDPEFVMDQNYARVGKGEVSDRPNPI